MKNSNDDKPIESAPFVGAWIRRSRLSREMYGLDDRMLTDIGVSRYEIPSIVEKSCPRIGIKDVLDRLFKVIARRNRNRNTARELAGLDDRLLADIGIARSEIGSVARGCYPERPPVSLPLPGLGFGSLISAKPANDEHNRAA